MASEGDSVMWLRVEDEDIDEAKLLRVTVNENTTGNGKKRRTSFVCKGSLYKSRTSFVCKGSSREPLRPAAERGSAPACNDR